MTFHFLDDKYFSVDLLIFLFLEKQLYFHYVRNEKTPQRILLGVNVYALLDLELLYYSSTFF